MNDPIPMNESESEICQFGYEQGKTATEIKYDLLITDLQMRVKVLEEKMRLLEPTGY